MPKPQLHDQTHDEAGFVDELKPGTTLRHGQYTIAFFLNTDGFGITSLARDTLDLKVVITACFPWPFCRRSRHILQARSRAHQQELTFIARLFEQVELILRDMLAQLALSARRAGCTAISQIKRLRRRAAASVPTAERVPA